MNMGKFKITEFFVYRWRYLIGYGLVAIGLVAVLILTSLYLPGGISNQEMKSVVDSSSTTLTNLGSSNVINLPYHLLQHASVVLFGVSLLSIKLPSIILAFLSAVGIILLLSKWFKPSIGVLASLIAITTSQFLFIAQNGTPDIMFLFWPIWLILLAYMVSNQQKYKLLWLIAFCCAAALSLYTPISIYIIIIFASVIIFHPHLRFILKHLPKIKLSVGVILGLLLLTPLVIAFISAPRVALAFLGIPSQWPNFGANISSLFNQYFGFAKPGGTTMITPFFELGSMLIIAIGVYSVIKTRATSKNYVIMLWTLLLIPVIIFNPSFTSITFLPLVLLLASGLSKLLSYWYNLFPHNPYARMAGLVPIVILVIFLVLSGMNRYIYGYEYDPNIVLNFSNNLQLIPDGTKNIVVTNDELPFYGVVAKYNKSLTVSTSPTSNTFLATRAAKGTFSGYRIERIITSSTKDNADRFYEYKK